jgi:hypothetical protein
MARFGLVGAIGLVPTVICEANEPYGGPNALTELA